jgi:hypothetical protein
MMPLLGMSGVKLTHARAVYHPEQAVSVVMSVHMSICLIHGDQIRKLVLVSYDRVRR